MKIVKPTIEEAQEVFDSLYNEDKFIINVQKLPVGGYEIQWIEQKSYTALDGVSFPDEVWTTIDCDMVLVQDLEPEHCRNILRMLLRQERKLLEAATTEMCNTLFGEVGLNEDALDNNPSKHTLH